MSESIDNSSPSAESELRKLPRLGLAPLLGRIFNQRRERVDMLGGLLEAYERHGNCVLARLPLLNMVYLFGPDANRKVLLDQDRIFSARQPWMMIMGRIFPNGLLLLDGDQHQRDRKIMHTAFKRPALREYAERMNPMIESEIADWDRQGDSFLAFPHLKTLTLNIAARIFVGMKLGPEAREMNEALEHLVDASMSQIRLPIPGTEFQRGLAARRFMVDFIGKLITERRGGDGNDMFSRLCNTITDEGERFEDQQIIDHMSFLMMAAHDTTTSTLTSILYELAKHPEWQEKVREEVRGYPGDAVAFDDLDRFPVVARVMKETLRRYPPLPVIPRVATEEFAFDGYRIPKGAMTIVSPLFTHNMADWWDHPERFDPDRFTPERAEHERHSHNFVPFGGGPHMCIGLRFAQTQITLILFHLIKRYRWSIPDGYVMPVQQAPISKPQDGLPLKLEALHS